MIQSNQLNEAELQATFVARVRAALPLLPATIKVEHYLSLRLGRRAMTIDGKEVEKGTVHGRYDVLVSLDVTPLILAELKAPEVNLTEDDVSQALSYARVHQPMVPLVLVTNGRQVRLLRTYDAKELQAEDVGAERLRAVLEGVAALAAAATVDAIRTLLCASGRVWGQLFKAWNDESLAAMTGGVREFARPLVGDFAIPRDAVRQVEAKLSEGARVVVLHGPPLAGVTNALAQFVRSVQAAPVLLIDAGAAPDVLQYVANRLSRELSVGVSKDDLRNWLNTRKGLLDVTLAIDGLPRNGVEELVDFANAGLLRLVLGMGSEEYRKASTVAGRSQHSLVGRSAVAIELLPLTEGEFYSACEVMRDSFGAYFFPGAQHVPDLRWPRRLRVLVATLPNATLSTPQAGHRETCEVLAPIPGPGSLAACSRAFGSDPALRFDLQKLAAAFLEDASQHIGDMDWVATTWGRPSVDPGILERELGEPRIERLRAQGILSWWDARGLGPRVLVRVEELLAYHVAEEWTNRLARLTEPDALVAELERLLSLSVVVPAGEVALAYAIFDASLRGNPVPGVAVPYLVAQRPTFSRLTEGSTVELLLKDIRIRLRFGEGADEQTIGNIQPWLVLSHLSFLPMAVEGYEASLNFSIFVVLGTASHLIIHPRPVEPEKVAGFHFHDLEGIGSVLCFETGIVEPLLQSMLNHAHESPEEMLGLARYAMEKREFHLAWRVLTVASAAQSSIDARVQRAAEAVQAALRAWWGAILDEMVQRHREDRERPQLPAPPSESTD